MEEPLVEVQPIVGSQKTNKVINAIVPYSDEDRRPTDVCCLILGLLFTIAIVVVPFLMKNQQTVWQLSYPSDSDGKVCGYDYPQHPYLYFANPPHISQRVCVASCPVSSDKPLDCKPANGILCAFGSSTHFTQTEPYDYPNGKLCMPTDSAARKELAKDRQLQNKFFFFKDYTRYYERMGITAGLALIVLILMQCCPGPMMHLIMFLSLLCVMALGTVFYVYHTETALQKIILASVLGVIFLFIVIQIIIYRQALRMTKIMMKQSKKLIGQNLGMLGYIPFFIILSAGFLYLIYHLYAYGLSLQPATFDNQTSLYYKPNKNSFIVSVSVLSVYLIWGFYCIRETFNFMIVTHVHYSVYKPQNQSSALWLAIKLILAKHLGSILGTSFVNSIFFLPASIFDNFRSCMGGKFYASGCCGSLLDLVRPDSIAYLILTGIPFCPSAKYCQYLWHESMTTQHIKSSMRIYKIAAQTMISTGAAIASLFITGKIDAPILYFTLALGVIIAAFFTGLHTDVCEAIRLIYLLQQQSYKRTDEFVKQAINSLNKADQIKFLRNTRFIYSNKEVAKQIKDVRQQFWNIQLPKPEKPNKKSARTEGNETIPTK